MKNIFTIWIPILIFHLLFWQSGMGLNMLLFSGVITGGVLIAKTYVVQRKEILGLLVIWNLIALFFVIHGSLLSLLAYWGVFLVLIGFLQQLRVRFWVFGLIESVRALFAGWAISIRTSMRSSSDNKRLLPILKQARLFLIPLLILIPFYLIYVQASADFGAIHDKISLWLSDSLSFDLNWLRIWHFVLGVVLVLAALGQRQGIVPLDDFTKNWSYSLIRRRLGQFSSWPHKSLALKREYQIAVISFVSLNLLLAFVNALDLFNVWFSFEERTAAELSQYVHQGTYLLILSILLAMAVVLGFFRGNLNFYLKNKTLVQLTYLWLAQNAFLAISVAIRNGHYIHHYGLAHGRIQVVFFLLLVLYGLYSMYQKVSGPKTIFFLIQKNGWAFLIALLLASTVNWDATITRYNLKNQYHDIPYHISSLTNNLLPLIEDQNSVFGAEPSIELKEIIHKGDRHKNKWEKSDWRSWTLSDYRQYTAWMELNEGLK